MLKRFMGKCSLIAVACTLSISAGAVAENQSTLDVPAGELVAALKEIALQSDVELLYRPGQLKDLKTEGLKGFYSPQEAIEILLKGTELRVHSLGSGAMVIAPKKEMRIGGMARQSLRLAEADTSSADTNKEAESVKLEEIVVTAQRRGEERLQDVPLSISVITAEEIGRRGLVSSEDYLRGIPGVNQTEDIFGSTIIIRGLESASAFQNAASGSTTATYFGETPTTGSMGEEGSTAVDLKLVDIERVEVLRGPQGTAFGSAALAGAVRTIPAAPKLDRIEGSLRAGYSSTARFGGGNYDVAGVLNVPLLKDKLALRAVGYRFDQSGFYRNVAGSDPTFQAEAAAFGAQVFGVDEKNIGAARFTGGRIAALLQATDALKVTLSYLTQKTERDGWSLQTTGPYKQAVLQVAPEHTVRGQKNYIFDTNIDLANALVEYDLGWANLLATYSYINSGAERTAGTRAFPLSAEAKGPHREHISEIRLGTHLDGAWNFLGGLFAEKVTDKSLADAFWIGSPESGLAAWGTTDRFLGTYQGQNKLTQKAAFAEVSWQFLPRTKLTGGVRAYDYDRTGGSTSSGALFGTSRTDVGTKASGTSFRANLTHNLTDNALVYAGWAQGFRLGRPTEGLLPGVCDLNSDGLVDGTTVTIESTRRIESDNVDSYELGGKFTLLDQRLLIAADVFSMDWTGLPFQASVDCPGIAFVQLYTANAGGARSRGIELQTNFRATEAFHIDVGGSWIRARFTKDVPASNVFEGNRLAGGPDFTANLALQYDFPIGGFAAFVRADSIYVGPFVTLIGTEETPLTAGGQRPGDYVKVDVSAQVAIRNTTIGLFVHNLTNEDAFTLGGDYPGDQGRTGQRMRPRTVGLQIGYKF